MYPEVKKEEKWNEWSVKHDTRKNKQKFTNGETRHQKKKETYMYRNKTLSDLIPARRLALSG